MSCCIRPVLVVQYNHYISHLQWKTEKHIALLTKLLEVSETRFFPCDISFIVFLKILICISVQTHKYIRRIDVGNTYGSVDISAQTLHEFFGCIMVRVSVYVLISVCCAVCVVPFKIVAIISSVVAYQLRIVLGVMCVQ